MNMRSVYSGVALVAVLVSGCSRDSIEAINLANEGDKAVKVNVEGAIQKYEQATKLDPSNHRITYKLSQAYERKEDWDKMASVLGSATQIAPDFANYWFKRGYAFVKKAETDNNNPDSYKEAIEPLKKCIEKDPNLAECYHFLGQALLWTGEEQQALDNYWKAIEHDPGVPYFYVEPAVLLVEYRLYKEAEALMKEGTRLIPLTDKSKDALYGMYTLQAQCAQGTNDTAGMVAALEKAEELAGETHPEIQFNLGSTYAVMDPPQKEKATRMLNAFTKRACRSAAASKFKDQCESANSLIQQLGGAK